MNCMRVLWEQHVMWTRSFIISTAEDLGDRELVTARLLRNPKDFACLFRQYYSRRCADEFEKLLTEHLMIGGDLVVATKNNEKEKADEAREKWYENADCIAQFLAKINPFQSERRWREMFYRHLEMTEKEAGLRLNSEYAEDIEIYDMIECEALKMADCMAMGIIRQFCM